MKLFRLDHIRLASVVAAGLLWLIAGSAGAAILQRSGCKGCERPRLGREIRHQAGCAEGARRRRRGYHRFRRRGGGQGCARERFLAAYDAKRSVKVAGKRATLIIGAEDFPFPIPLIRTRTGWEFDTAEGRKEILYRRIGRNELDTIQTVLAFFDAENEYADKQITATASAPMRGSGLSPVPTRKTVCIGPRTITKVRSANSPRRRTLKATRPVLDRSPITATTTAS